MKKRILLTGATGFLGFNLAVLLLKENFILTVNTRRREGISFLENLDCKIEFGSLNDEVFVDHIVENQDFVIHCASLTDQFISDFEIYRKANVETTELLMCACEKYKIQRFIYVSTANCFTNGTLGNPGIEDSDFMHYLENSNYAFSKFLAQKMVLEKTKEHGFPAIVVAPTFMIGPFDRGPSSGKLLLYFLKRRFIFYPAKSGKNFVDVEAVSRAVCNGLTKGKVGSCYLLAGENRSYKDYFKKIKTISDNKNKQLLIPIPYFMVFLFIQLFKNIPSKKLKMLAANLQMLFSENYFTGAKAMQELEMRSTDMEKVIEKSVDWFMENNYLN